MRRILSKSIIWASALALAGCSGGAVAQGEYGPGPYPYQAPPPSYQYDTAQDYQNVPPPPAAEYPPAAQDYGPPPQYTSDYPPPQAAAEIPAVDVNVFYNQLAPYGQWTDVPGYGRCFRPFNVGPDWRPYTYGHWVYSTYGWTWVSNEPFGWATCHYGRWAFVANLGWVWVPGTIWAPAWVAWRVGDGYCGWAPLPPNVGFQANFFVGDVATAQLPPTFFTFVAERDIFAPRIHEHILPVQRNVTIISKTTNVTNIRVVNNTVVNEGVPATRIERDTGRRVQRVQVRTVTDPKEAQRNVPGAVHIYTPPATKKVQVPARAARPNERRPLAEQPRPNAPRTQTPERRPGTVAPAPTPTPERRPNTVTPAPTPERRPMTEQPRPVTPERRPETTPPAAERRATPPPAAEHQATPPAPHVMPPPANQRPAPRPETPPRNEQPQARRHAPAPAPAAEQRAAAARQESAAAARNREAAARHESNARTEQYRGASANAQRESEAAARNREAAAKHQATARNERNRRENASAEAR